MKYATLNNMNTLSTTKSSGFSLLEFLVAIIILVILITIAMPNFRAVLQNNRTQSLANELVSALNLARSEAIKRGISVSLCAAADSTLSSCGSNWNNGWLVFTNPNEDASFDNNTSEILLRTQQIIGPGYAISNTPSSGVATYTSTGFPLSTTGNMVFTINASGCTGNNNRNVTISTTGRITNTAVAC